MPLSATNRPPCWSSLPITLVLACAAILVIFPVQDFDIFWHLANGRAMVEQGRIINQEIFSFTAQGKEFSNHAWLAQIFFFLVFKAFGANGLIAVKVLITTAIGLALYLFGRSQGLARLPSSLIWLLALGASLFRYVERPELFSLLLLAVTGVLLLSCRTSAAAVRALPALPLIMVAWDFLHGALYGVIFVAAFVFGETTKYLLSTTGRELSPPLPREIVHRLWLWVGVTVLVMLVSPYGLRTYEIFIEFTRNNVMTSMTAEFQPATLSGQPLFWGLLAVSVITVLVAGRRLDITSLCLLVPFAGLAIRYVRGIGPFAIVAAILLAVNLPPILARLAPRPERRRRQDILFLLLLSIGLGSALVYKFSGPPRYDSWGGGISADGFPIGAARFVQAANLRGNMYNTDRYGGYLAYYLFPERKIFHYNHHMLFDALERYVHEPETRAQWQINYAIIGRSDEWDMFARDGFVPVYWEPTGAIMVKENDANREIIRRYAIRYFSPVMPQEELYRLAKNPGVMPVLAREISDYLAQRQDREKTEILVNLLGRSSLVPPATALELLVRAERYNTGDPRLAAALGSLYYQQGLTEKAATHLTAALAIDPGLVEARFSLAYLLYDQGELQKALDHFQRVLATTPRHADTIYGLGLTLEKLGRRQEAKGAFRDYLDLAPKGPWAEKARNFVASPPEGS